MSSIPPWPIWTPLAALLALLGGSSIRRLSGSKDASPFPLWPVPSSCATLRPTSCLATSLYEPPLPWRNWGLVLFQGAAVSPFAPKACAILTKKATPVCIPCRCGLCSTPY